MTSSRDRSGSNDSPGGAPSDLELMMWVDGELTGPRSAEIAAHLEGDARARAVVAGLERQGRWVEMAGLERAVLAGGDDLASRVMASIEKSEPRSASAERSRAAPRREAAPFTSLRVPRRIVALGLAAAVTAALGLGAIARRTAARGDEDGAGAGEGTSTIVDVVDFGARPGAIFYVPSEGETAAAVVWLTDDDTPASSEPLSDSPAPPTEEIP